MPSSTSTPISDTFLADQRRQNTPWYQRYTSLFGDVCRQDCVAAAQNGQTPDALSDGARDFLKCQRQRKTDWFDLFATAYPAFARSA
jgi:hypothetical protein